jgi:hypothetical protein
MIPPLPPIFREEGGYVSSIRVSALLGLISGAWTTGFTGIRTRDLRGRESSSYRYATPVVVNGLVN